MTAILTGLAAHSHCVARTLSIMLLVMAAPGCCCLNLGDTDRADEPSAGEPAPKPSPTKATKEKKPKARLKKARKTPKQETSVPIPARADEFESVEQAVEATVVRIDLYDGKRKMTYGTGFFVSEDGLMATNYHVFSDVLEREQTPHFTFAPDGERKKVPYEVVRCMDHRDIDLCLVKLDHTPRAYLEVMPRDVKDGTEIFSIGNPKKKSFVLARGKVLRTYEDVRKVVKINDYTRNRSVQMLRLDAPLRKGFSGGPVVDADGALVGVNSVILHPPADKKDLDDILLAISSREFARYLKKRTPFDLESFTKRQIAKNPILTTPAHKLTEAQIKKACTTFQKKECIAGIKAACDDPKRKSECKRVRAHFRKVAGLGR